MKKLWLLSIMFVFAAVALVSCHQEEPAVGPEPSVNPYVIEKGSVKVDLSSDGQGETKSLISIEATEFKSAFLFAFDSDTGHAYYEWKDNVTSEADGIQYDSYFPMAVYTEDKTFFWDLPLSPHKVDIYVVVNPDAATEAVLREMRTRPCPDPAVSPTLTAAEFEALKMVLEGSNSFLSFEQGGMPMSCVKRNIVITNQSDALSFTVKRLFARYDIRLNITDFVSGGWIVTAANVSAIQSNKRVDYFYIGSGAGTRAEQSDLTYVMDFATEDDIATINSFGPDHMSTGAITLYIQENCQGDIGTASRWDKVYGELGDAVANCSCIDFAIEAVNSASQEQKSFRFRFYPGQDDEMRRNFDIVRNSYRKVCLRLRPDTQTEGFSFVGDSFSIAPGEVKTVRYETSLAEDDISFIIQNQGILTDNVKIKRAEWHGDNQSSAEHVTLYPNYGLIQIKAESGAEEGTSYKLHGGNDVNGLFDEVGFSVSNNASFWKDVEVLDYPTYRGQWMVVQLPENIFGVGEYLDASVWNEVLQSDGSYLRDNNTYSSVQPYRNSDSFGNGKTNILKSHVWYDHTSNKLFVYCYVRQYNKDNRCVFKLALIDSAGGEEYERYAKEFEYTVKNPVFILKGYNDESNIICETTITDTGGRRTQLDGVYFDVVDSETYESIRFDWGQGNNGGGCMSGMSYAPYECTTPGFYFDNFYVESYIDYDTGNDFDDNFTAYWPDYPDQASYDWNIYNFTVASKDVRSDFAYDTDTWISFFHSYFSNEITIYPTRKLIAAPVSRLNIMEAAKGTNIYNKMSAGPFEAEDECYLMYGIKKTYFIKLENISGTPSVSLSIPSSESPYLQSSLTPFSSGVYRLDLWVDRYEDPLDFDDTAAPYSTHADMDLNAGDKSVTVTVSVGTYTDEIVCNVLHKRFGVDLIDVGRDNLRFEMWNPLGLTNKVLMRGEFDLNKYARTHPLTALYGEGGLNHEISHHYFQYESQLNVTTVSSVRQALEASAATDRGIACGYAKELHPDFIGINTKDLVLFYPEGEVQDLVFKVTFENEDQFSTFVPGLSLNGIDFNILNFISYNGYSVPRFNYTYSTLSNFMLQGSWFDTNTDELYYYIPFWTPTHWTRLNETYGGPSSPKYTNDNPMHIGGNDSARSILSSVKVYNGTDYGKVEENNPTIKYE